MAQLVGERRPITCISRPPHAHIMNRIQVNLMVEHGSWIQVLRAVMAVEMEMELLAPGW